MKNSLIDRIQNSPPILYATVAVSAAACGWGANQVLSSQRIATEREFRQAAEESLRKAEAERNKLVDENRRALSAQSDTERKLESLKLEKAVMARELEKANVAFDKLADRQRKSEEQIGELRESKGSLESQLLSARSEKDGGLRELAKANGEVGKLTERIANLEQAKTELAQQLAGSARAMSDAKRDADRRLQELATENQRRKAVLDSYSRIQGAIDEIRTPPLRGVVPYGEEEAGEMRNRQFDLVNGKSVAGIPAAKSGESIAVTTAFVNVYAEYPKSEWSWPLIREWFLKNRIGALPPGTLVRIVHTKVVPGGYYYVTYELLRNEGEIPQKGGSLANSPP